MNRILLSIILLLPLISYSKTVKEVEITRSINTLGLFDKVCMGVYLDDDELNQFLIENNFTDLNDETKKENNSKDSEVKNYSIDHEKTRFFLEISPKTCSVSTKNSNQDIFNFQFKKFRKEITQDSIIETSKSFEFRKNGVSYKISSYSYFSEDYEKLPFEILLNQTNSNQTPYKLKLTVKIDKRAEIIENKKDLKKLNLKTTNKINSDNLT